MADDELHVHIDKAFWPRGVIRGLTPALRTLGDKNGNLVMAALPAKGQIMVKGPQDMIEKVKPQLKELIAEHFPDAPVPDELEEGAQKVEEKPAPSPPRKVSSPKASPKRQPAPAPVAASSPMRSATAAPATAISRMTAAAPARTAAPAKRRVAAEVDPLAKGPAPKVKPRQPRAGGLPNAAPSLLWECMRKGSSFARPRALAYKAPRFSAEPANLMGIHAFRYSGLAAEEALDVKPKKSGDKEVIELTLSHAESSRRQRPRSATFKVGLSKCAKKGLAMIDREVGHSFYRRGTNKLARLKYMKIKRSFKQRKRTVRSRRTRA